MRKLGIILAVMIAATLGYSGTATAQSQEQFCDEVIGGIADGAADSPIDDTTAGLQADCNESDPTAPNFNVNNTLCGLQSDVAETFDPALGEAVDGVHSGVHDAETGLEDGGFPDIVDADHPCGDTPPDPPGDDDDNNGDDDDDTQVEAAQRSNATADGGLPRTGGELFAGAGLGLMSLGALVRRFLP